MSTLTIQLLGAWQVLLPGGDTADLKYDKVRALLAYLAVESHRAHRREKLAALLWPDLPPDASRNNLRQTLHTLRRAVDDHNANPPYFITTRTTVQFAAGSNTSLDVTHFKEALDLSRRHAHRSAHSCQTCAARLEDAVALYRGPFLAGLALPDSIPFEEWALLQREQLNRLVLDALQQLRIFHQRRGDYERALTIARRQLSIEPWREQAHRALMRLYLLLDRRDDALSQYETCRRLLRQELDVDPEERTTELYEQIRDTHEPQELVGEPAATGGAPPFRVPLPPTPFIGRTTELEEIGRLLDDAAARLITITGPGGAGKTRLALQLAADQTNLFVDGIYFLDLTAHDDPDRLPALIASALSLESPVQPQPGAPGARDVGRALATRELLLILDNFDHLVEHALILEPILRLAPHVNFLVTSRQRLNLQGEWLYPLAGFATPAPGALFAPSASGAEALQLFLSGARRAGNPLLETPENLAHIAHICRLVDGLPLAIELAAAWTPTLSLAEIAAEIENSVQFLTVPQRDRPQRHHSLWAVMAQSWRRLPSTEQSVLAQLSLFDGPFSRPAARAVAGATLPVLASLVDKSLLQRRPPRRYALHPLLRQYAAHRQEESGGARAAQIRLLDYYLQEAQAIAEAGGDARSRALNALDAEYENVRVALRTARSDENPEKGLRLAAALYRFWYWRSHFREGSDWLSAFLRNVEGAKPDASPSPTLLADAQYANGVLLTQQDRHTEARRSLQQSLDLRRRLDDRAGQAACLNSLGIIAWRRQDFDEAIRFLEQSLALRRELGDADLGPPLNNLGLVALAQGDYHRAENHFGELLRRARQGGQEMGVAISLGNLALALVQQGRREEARQHLVEAVALFQKFEDREGIAGCLETAAALAIAGDAPALAATLCAAAAALRREIHVPLTPTEQQRYDKTITAAQSNLSPTAFSAAWQKGQSLPLPDALSLVSKLQESGDW